MARNEVHQGAKGNLLAGLGLLTAAGFVALSFAGDALGAGAPDTSALRHRLADAPDARDANPRPATLQRCDGSGGRIARLDPETDAEVRPLATHHPARPGNVRAPAPMHD